MRPTLSSSKNKQTGDHTNQHDSWLKNVDWSAMIYSYVGTCSNGFWSLAAWPPISSAWAFHFVF